MVNKITTPPTTSELISKVNELVDNKQDKLTVGAGIDITSDVISNAGVRSVVTGTTNGTISVNTNGTTADVSVYGLGSAAYTASAAYATAAQGALADTAVQPSDLSTYVTTNTAQDITARKTFFGEKAIYFKQNTASNKLGFTLYDNNNKEVGALEFRPNTIGSTPILTLNSPSPLASSQSYGNSYVGFRYWNNLSNILAPYSNNLYNKNLFIPVTFTNGTTTVESTSTDGSVDISSLLPTVDQTYSSTSTNAQSGVAVASAISGKADDNAVVHIAGTETITGDKTFTGSLTIPAQTLVTKQSNNADEGGELQFEIGTNSVLQTNVRLDVYQNRMRIFGADSNNIIHDVFAADLEENRCRVATQATSSNDDSVATTAFVKSILSELYPVGSIYIGTQATCPLATLISGSTWTLVSKGRVLQGVDTGQTAGSTVAAGLPNIQAHFNYTVTNTIPTGATYNDYDANGQVGNIAGTGYETVFDASRSNSIYGSSTTVQPPAYLVNIWKRTA